MDGPQVFSVCAVVGFVCFFGGVFTVRAQQHVELRQLQAEIVAQGYAEWYSDEPGAAPDKFRLIEDDEQNEVK